MHFATPVADTKKPQPDEFENVLVWRETDPALDALERAEKAWKCMEFWTILVFGTFAGAIIGRIVFGSQTELPSVVIIGAARFTLLVGLIGIFAPISTRLLSAWGMYCIVMAFFAVIAFPRA